MIEIKISGATPLEALASITAFGFRCMTNEDVAAAANRIYEREQQKEGAGTATQAPQKAPSAMPQEEAQAMVDAARNFTPPKSDAAAPKEEPPKEPYVEEPPFDPEPETPAPKAPAKIPTLEEVRDAGIKVAKEYGRDVVAAILQQFEATSMTSLKEKDRAAFLKALKGVGESNA